MKVRIKRTFLACLLAFSVFSFAIGNVNARGGTFVVSPSQEVREVVELSPKDEVSGHVLVQSGRIDFHVTNPSKQVVLCYNQIANSDFNFTASEKGDYIMHFTNSLSKVDVTVQLNYSVLFPVTSQLDVNVGYSVGTVHIVAPPPSPFDWLSILRLIGRLITYGVGISRFLVWLFQKIWNFLKSWGWRKKYKKSRTPVVLTP